jgi:hypothetical protein
MKEIADSPIIFRKSLKDRGSFVLDIKYAEKIIIENFATSDG